MDSSTSGTLAASRDGGLSAVVLGGRSAIAEPVAPGICPRSERHGSVLPVARRCLTRVCATLSQAEYIRARARPRGRPAPYPHGRGFHAQGPPPPLAGDARGQRGALR